MTIDTQSKQYESVWDYRRSEDGQPSRFAIEHGYVGEQYHARHALKVGDEVTITDAVLSKTTYHTVKVVRVTKAQFVVQDGPVQRRFVKDHGDEYGQVRSWERKRHAYAHTAGFLQAMAAQRAYDEDMEARKRNAGKIVEVSRELAELTTSQRRMSGLSTAQQEQVRAAVESALAQVKRTLHSEGLDG